MRPNQHWHLFCLATTWWTLFFIAGLNTDYFQTAPLWFVLVVGELLPAIALAYFGWRRCTRNPQLAWATALWIGFYMTVPLFVYDYLYLANYQGRGLSFLRTHWYLTSFYVIPWIILPPIARYAALLQKQTKAK